jgi:hypothetical protein
VLSFIRLKMCMCVSERDKSVVITNVISCCNYEHPISMCGTRASVEPFVECYDRGNRSTE